MNEDSKQPNKSKPEDGELTISIMKIPCLKYIRIKVHNIQADPTIKPHLGIVGECVCVSQAHLYP